MESHVVNRAVGMTLIAALALAQGVLGVLRAFHWLNVGSDLLGQGLLLLPMVGLLAIFRGALVAVIALMYVVFACGAFLGLDWARWLGIVVAAITLLLVVSIVVQGESPARALVWAIVPGVMICYLFSLSGRQARNADVNAQ